MRTSSRFSMWLLGVFSMVAAATFPGAGRAQAPDQYPVLEAVANKVILKYQQSSCEQLWQKQSAPPSEEQQRVVALLRSDAQIRTAFINKVAAPIANKMFDCGMLP
jgi:hypothetical protein